MSASKFWIMRSEIAVNGILTEARRSTIILCEKADKNNPILKCQKIFILEPMLEIPPGVLRTHHPSSMQSFTQSTASWVQSHEISVSSGLRDNLLCFFSLLFTLLVQS